MTTWFCDPTKYVVDPDTSTCINRLPLGTYPDLKNVEAGDVASPELEITLAEPCNDACRTCWIEETMTGGNPDYCTSCDIDGSYPILDLGNLDESNNPQPTCLNELPAHRAIVIVQNNKLLGVLNLATQYGGANQNGTRTDQAEADPDLALGSNQSDNPPSFEDCPEDVEDCTSLPPPPPPDGGGNMPEGQEGMPMDAEPDMADIPPEIRIDISLERHLPKIMDIIEMYDILGIGINRDIEETCTFASGEERFPRNMHPSIMYLAIPCPPDCES